MIPSFVKASRVTRNTRGFTMVELIVAMAAGVLVSSAAFLLARNSTRFFQREARLTTAQFGTTVALSRMQADLQRAGFMSTPNIADDPMRCGAMTTYDADGTGRLAGVQIDKGGSKVNGGHALSTLNDLDPDALVVGGNFGTTEHFGVQTLAPGDDGIDVILQTDDGAMQRALAAGTLKQTFKVGRIMRLVDKEGRVAFGVISGVELNEAKAAAGSGKPRISIAKATGLPTGLPLKSSSTCGCDDLCVGGMVNAVARMRYDVRPVNPATYKRYQGMFQLATHGLAARHKGFVAPLRTELIRVELDAKGVELDDTLEVLAEYAVDLKFGITVSEGGPEPTTVRHEIGSEPVYEIANIPGLDNAAPHTVRAVQVRLSVRAAQADRRAGLDAPNDPGGLYRFNLGDNIGFARVRTLIADVSLPNQFGVNW